MYQSMKSMKLSLKVAIFAEMYVVQILWNFQCFGK